MAEAISAQALREPSRSIPDLLLDRRIARCILVAAGCLVLANCSSSGSRMSSGLGVSASPKVIADGQPVPKGGGRYWTGQPYVVAGRVYRPMRDARGYTAVGLASWYGAAFRGRYTSNREIFDGAALSAAHPTLPLPSYVRVTNLDNQRSVVVRVNDRGPFHGNRLIDVSKKTAEVLGFRRNGTAQVRIAYVGPASLSGSDDRKLLATYEVGGRPARADTLLAQDFPPAPRQSGARALLAAVVPPVLPAAAPARIEARPVPPAVHAVVPLPAPPPVRVAAAEPPHRLVAHAPLQLGRNDLMPSGTSDPIGHLVADGHPPLPQARRFAYAPGIEPGHEAARRVHADFAGYREPVPLRSSIPADLPDDASALAPLH